MEIIDISWPISATTTGYKDKNVVHFEEVKNFNKDGVRDHDITLSTHTGTHIDAAAHFMRDGKTIDEMKPERTLGPCKVLDMIAIQDGITRDDLIDHNIQENDIILFKTINSSKPATEKFNPHFIYLEESGARYLAEKKIKAVGIDYLGIERGQKDHPTHIILMQHDIAIIEGLRLQAVDQGIYFFVCLPLYLIGLEAAPARAVLIKNL